MKLQTFDSSFSRGKSHFEDDGTQKYLVFQTVYKKFKIIANSYHILVSKSKGFPDRIIKPPAASNILVLLLQIKFHGSNLNQKRVRFTRKFVANIGIVYRINL